MIACFNKMSALCLALTLACHANAQTETQTFDSSDSAAAAGWLTNEEGMSDERECDGEFCETDLGWKSTNLAGENSGEGGGLLHRSGRLGVGFYADTSIGELNFEMPFSASGKVALSNISFNGHAHFGFFDAIRLLADPLDYGAMVGFQIAEPGGDVAPNLRWGHMVVDDVDGRDSTNASFTEGLPDGESLDFAIDYNPEEGNGLITLAIGDEDPSEYELSDAQREAGATITGFGVFTGPHIGSARPDYLEIVIDDVTYTSLDAPDVLAGDYNSDGQIDLLDIDLQAEAMADPNADLTLFDENGDGAVDFADRAIWAKDHIHSWVGDADLNGEFNSGDFVEVFTAGKYETGQLAGWAEGDWDGNRLFDSGDFVAAFTDGGYELGPRPAVANVPEPHSAALLLIGALLSAPHRRRR